MATGIAETKWSDRVSPAFVEKLKAAAKRSGRLSAEQVYTLWREYCTACSNYDQSAIWSEFEEWYRKELEPIGA